MFSSLVAMAREGQPFSADRAQNQSINAFWLLNQIAEIRRLAHSQDFTKKAWGTENYLHSLGLGRPVEIWECESQEACGDMRAVYDVFWKMLCFSTYLLFPYTLQTDRPQL